MASIPTHFDPLGSIGGGGLPAGWEIVDSVHIKLNALPEEGFLFPIKPYSTDGWECEMEVGNYTNPGGSYSRAIALLKIGPTLRSEGYWSGRIVFALYETIGNYFAVLHTLLTVTSTDTGAQYGGTNGCLVYTSAKERNVRMMRNGIHAATIAPSSGNFIQWTLADVAGQADSVCGIPYWNTLIEYDFRKFHFASDTNGVIDIFPVRHADGREGLWAPHANKLLEL